MLYKKILVLAAFVWTCYVIIGIYKDVIKPILVKKTTKEIEKNPKALTDIMQNDYSVLNDIDVILITNKRYKLTPKLKVSKDKTRLELLLPEKIYKTIDYNVLIHILLVSKLLLYIGPRAINYDSKSNRWLSELINMLEDTDVSEKDI